MKGRQFELRVFKGKHDDMGLAFGEVSSEQEREKGQRETKQIRIWGTPARVLTETLLSAIKRQGYRSTALSPQRKDPFILDEAPGVRLGLFFFALKPLRKVSRMEEIISGIERMSDEETYYWYAKCSNGRSAARARKALRILFSSE